MTQPAAARLPSQLIERIKLAFLRLTGLSLVADENYLLVAALIAGLTAGLGAASFLYCLRAVHALFFYVAISFNPEEVADNMKKYGGFIPGIRAGRPTAEYLSYVLNRITWPGSLYLGLIALVPTMALAGFGANQNFPFGGTSILIIVGVGLETVKQIESQLQQRNYEGFLR